MRVAPLRQQDGVWRVNGWPLSFWTLGLNTVFWLLLHFSGQPVPSKRLLHPAAVTGKNIVLYSLPDASPAATILGVVTQGDTLELEAVEASGWCRVTVPTGRPGQEPITGYLPAQHLTFLGSPAVGSE